MRLHKTLLPFIKSNHANGTELIVEFSYNL